VSYRSRFLTDFFLTCYTDRSRSEIEQSLALLSESETQLLFEKVFRRVIGDDTQYAAEVFSKNGWFMDMEFPGIPAPEVAMFYETGQKDRAEGIIADYYRQRIPSIKSELTSKYPLRSRILTKAFQMHQEEEYDVSVPLFLIHADGICREAFGRQFFSVDKKGMIARPIVERRNVDWIWNAVVEPFRLRLPMAEGCNDPNAWNRHVILHGVNVDYGNEINSLKAISLLSFLCGLDTYARTKEIERNCDQHSDLRVEHIDILLEQLRTKKPLPTEHS
jgi:hypothetical protein